MSSLLIPYLFICLLVSVSSSAPQLCSQHDAAALFHFKSSFSLYGVLSDYLACELAGSKYYPRTISWKEGADCCSWDGVACDPLNGHVISLDLTCSWLRGSIPSNSTLFLLRHLRKLNLAFNDFGDSDMPSEFDRLAGLEYLNLSSSSFGGHVPPQVSHLSKLVSLDLSGNYAQTLDENTLEALVNNLTVARHLFLDRINMSSIDPNLFMNLSSSLRSLSLKECDLRGNMSGDIFHLPELKLLNLGGTKT
ncbi:Receptor like protein 33 [Hibiscus syriacus]|uniref:Receptor like protein 33 n=1 Tax=Hibiscus syriacus TaxID=106335 RepID=A0A6A3C3V2_HIBSY|nr:Receptor like protein 33 [Hibiscus syriacus]